MKLKFYEARRWAAVLPMVFGLWAATGLGAQAQLNMTNGSGTHCSGTFYDSGGPTATYANSEDLTYTIFPTAGNVVQVIFNSFGVETCCDNLKIYNGNSTGAPLLGTYTASPGIITSTAADGSLTFVFHSDGSVGWSGWDATIACVGPCAGTPNPGNTLSNNMAPCSGSNFTLSLQNGNPGIGSTFQWQSSTDGTNFTPVPTGGTAVRYITSHTVPTYYRCQITCANGGAMATSTPVLVGVGSCVNMGNGSTTTCGGTFFDSGGPTGDYSSSEDYTYTIYPTPGNFLRVNFTLFEMETCCDNMKIYDGNSTAATLIGTYNSFIGSVTSTAADGSLTFQFHSDGSVVRPGWVGMLTCVANPPCAGTPAPGTATATASTVCPGVNFSVNVQNPMNGSGVAYQWQSSPDGFTWGDITGQTGTTFTGSQTQTMSYRLRAICLAGPDTGYSSVANVNLTPFLNCYCTSNATAATNSSIRNVTIPTAGINNTSTGACDQYTNFSSVTGVVSQGLDYPFSVLVEDCEGSGFDVQRVAIFVDWNHDGDLTDPGENVYSSGTLPGAATVQFNGSISVPATALLGSTRMRVINRQGGTAIDPCGTYTTGETEDYLLNVSPPPANEAGVLAITKPGIAACSLGNQLWVNMQNLGSNALTQANFTVRVNGISIPVSNPWTGNVPAQSTGEIQVPVTYTFADGDSISVQVSMPNGVVEDSLLGFNNQTGRVVWSGLSGIKTVNGAPGANNYANVNAAISALQLRGVCDTVYFRITAGTYNTRHVFVPYLGAGAGKLAVFESATGNAADVVFADSNSTAADNYVFRFDGGDGYMLRNLTGIAYGGGSFSTVVDIRNGANDLIFDGNTFVGDTAAAYNTTDFDRIVVASAQATDDYRTTLRNNIIRGGNRGVNLGGSSSFESGVVLEGNTIEKYGYIGVILGSSSGFTVRGNTFRPRTNLTQTAYGVYATGTIDGATVDGNDIQTGRTGAGILLNNVKGAIANEVWVSNNFIYMGDSNATTASYGILVQDINSTGITLANNSISLRSGNATAGAVSIADGTQIRVLNNNIGAFGASPALRVEKTYSVNTSDHNNLFGTNLANVTGSLYTTLAGLQGATSKDAASVSVNPGFNGTDLHTCVPQLNAAALALPQVTVDFDGDPRSATPDIGADEFVGDAGDLLAADTFLKCPSDAVTLGNTPLNGVTYSWTPSGSTSQITVTGAGTYIVTATSACGSFSDTAVVTNKPLPTANFTATSVGLTGVFSNTSVNGTSYLWDFGDGQTSSDFSPSHVYPSGGTYSVTLTVTNECGSVTHGPVSVNVVSAGINEAEGNLKVTLFPNPTNDRFTVTMAGQNGQATTLSVIDVTGKVVLTHNLPAGVNQVTLDATSFASGVYSVKISNGELQKVIRLVRN